MFRKCIITCTTLYCFYTICEKLLDDAEEQRFQEWARQLIRRIAVQRHKSPQEVKVELGWDIDD